MSKEIASRIRVIMDLIDEADKESPKMSNLEAGYHLNNAYWFQFEGDNHPRVKEQLDGRRLERPKQRSIPHI